MLPWNLLEEALATQHFIPVGLAAIRDDSVAEWEARGFPEGDAISAVDVDRRWDLIVASLRRLRRKSDFLALRVDDKDLLLVIGRGMEQTDAAHVADYVAYAGDVLAALSKAARRFRVAGEVIEGLEDLSASAGRVLDAKAATRLGRGANDKAARLALQLEAAQVAAGAQAAALALSLLRFRGVFRCVVVVADSVVDETELAAWVGRPQRVRRLSMNPRSLTSSVVEAWLWDVNHGRIIDAHHGLRAKASRPPIPGLTAESLQRALRFA